jgi:tRNA (guanine10-N2)-dimethyltransferase
MRRLVFELSGEHPTLPQSEIVGCIEAYGWPYRIVESYDQVLVVETDADVSILAHRLALTHHILEFIFQCKADKDEILAAMESAGMGLKEGETFLVRINKIRDYGHIDTSFEGKLGAVLWRRGFSVDLKKPDAVFRAIITQDVCIFGRLLQSVDRGQYEERAPMKKPFFLPGVLMPRVCRAAVNMTRIRDGWMLDPFSGTGGILVEAVLISDTIHVVGCDVQNKMVLGTRTNLRYYGHNFDVVREDSLRMGIKDNSADAMITDFPYGQSTPIVGAPVGEFYIGALREMLRVLKDGKYAVIISMAPMEKLLREAGFNVIEVHQQYVHKSLTRHISLVRKSD